MTRIHRAVCISILATSLAAGCAVEEADDNRYSPPALTTCGNQVLDAGEMCDGTELAGATCESQGYGPGTLACRPGCRAFDTSQCEGGDTCGNGQIDANEVCDGANLNGETCATRGFASGNLACATSCVAFDTSDCEQAAETCGNGVLDLGESCDGQNLGGSTCTSMGFAGGVLRCTAQCTLDTSGCEALETCGDGSLGTLEACEGFELRGETCVSLGFDGGTLRCSAACTFDTSLCTQCGNNVLEVDEVCDGAEFGGRTCASELGAGWVGELSCQSCTTISTSNCQETAGRDEQCGSLLPCAEPYVCDPVYDHPDYGVVGACKQRCSQPGSSLGCSAGESCFTSGWVEQDPDNTGTCSASTECNTAEGFECVETGAGFICARDIAWCGTMVDWVADHSSVEAIEAGPTCNEILGHAMCRDSSGPNAAGVECVLLEENGDGVCIAFCEGDLNCGAGYQCVVPEDGLWRIYQEDSDPCSDDSECDTDAGFRCEPDTVLPQCQRPYEVCVPL